MYSCANPAEPFKFRTESCRIAARLRGLKRYSTGVSRSIMPLRNVDGVETRSKTTPSKTPPGDGAPPVTPASGTGRKRKKKTSSRKKSGRKVAKKLNKSFDEDDVSSDEESVASGTGAAGGGTPSVRPEPAHAAEAAKHEPADSPRLAPLLPERFESELRVAASRAKITNLGALQLDKDVRT